MLLKLRFSSLVKVSKLLILQSCCSRKYAVEYTTQHQLGTFCWLEERAKACPQILQRKVFQEKMKSFHQATNGKKKKK